MLHSSQSHPVLRKWSSGQPNTITASSLVYPIFIAETGMDIPSLPGVSRFAVSDIVTHLSPLVSKGLTSVLIFSVPSSNSKSLESLDSPTHNPAIPAIRAIRSAFPNLLVCVDVCLCAFTDNGHCGIINARGCIDSPLSHPYMLRLTTAYVEAGAHVIAPSDMMDNRIKAIKDRLSESSCHDVAVMSYSAKFASCFYESGVKSGPSDRSTYQLPPMSRGLARQALARDVQEGANLLMVKPGGAYLDIIRDAKESFPDYPIAVYQYAMLYWAAHHGVFDLKDGVLESLNAMLRSGASIVITYFVPQILDWLKEAEK